MSLDDLLSRLAPALERAQAPFMLTGSVASSAHGLPRSTRDLDILIAPTQAQLIKLIREFPHSVYYADEEQALQALVNRSQFNVIDFVTGWKIDFIIAEDSEYGRTAMMRRMPVAIAGTTISVAAPEDVLIAKLRWSQKGGSDRQLEDAAGIVTTQGNSLDYSYIERWVREFHLQKQWDVVRKS